MLLSGAPHTGIFFIASHKVVLAYFCFERHKKNCLNSHWVCSTMNFTCQDSCPHLVSLLYDSFPDSMIEIPALNVFHDWAPKHQLLPHRSQMARLLSAPSFKIHWLVLISFWDYSFSSHLINILSHSLQPHFWYLCLSRRPFLPSKLNFLSSRIILF